MIKKNYLKLTFMLALSFALLSCKEDVTQLNSSDAARSHSLEIESTKSNSATLVETPNSWVPAESFGNGQVPGRSDAAGFQIGDQMIFVGTGESDSSFLNDFWQFDGWQHVWVKRTDFPGVARKGAVGFSIETKGYIGLGVTADGVELNDFYEYDINTYTWRRIKDFPGVARSGAVAFSFYNAGGIFPISDFRAYVGTGYNKITGNLADIWKYDLLTGDWTQVESIPTARTNAYAFTATANATLFNYYGVVGGGRRLDAYKFIPEDKAQPKGKWIRIPDGPYYEGMTTFTLNDFVDGHSKNYVQGANKLWMYDVANTNNPWIPKASLPVTLTYSTGFSEINAYGYVTTGKLNGANTTATFKYIPD